MIRVLIADDHPVVRQGLVDMLEGDAHLEPVGQASSYDELWPALADTPCDVLLLDLKMPGGDGLDAMSRLGRRHPDVAVLVLSTYPEDQFLVRMIRAGASGYLEKSCPPDEIRDAIRTVAQGRRYVTTEGARVLADALGDPETGPDHDVLSDREFQVLRLLASGQRVTEIAESLHLSAKTVSTYRSRMMEKMGFENDAEAIRYALERELTE